MEYDKLISKESEFDQINQLYDECLSYLQTLTDKNYEEEVEKENLIKLKDLSLDKEVAGNNDECSDDPGYETVKVKDVVKKEPVKNKNVREVHKKRSEKPIIVEARNKVLPVPQKRVRVPEKQGIDEAKKIILPPPEKEVTDDKNVILQLPEKEDTEAKNVILPLPKREVTENKNVILPLSEKEVTEDKNVILPIPEKEVTDAINVLLPKKQVIDTKNVIIPIPEEDVIQEIPKIDFKVENEMKSNESINTQPNIIGRLRKLSQQLPKITLTRSSDSYLDLPKQENHMKLAGQYRITKGITQGPRKKSVHVFNIARNPPPLRTRAAYGDFPKRLVSKSGIENVALISNVPYEKIRLLNDTFHTLINLRWRWIVGGTIVTHFAIWLVFAVFWYFTALAHYDFDPDPPKRSCITGGKDFVTIFLASVEAQTTIGFGDRTIDEECPESIFLLIMQLILGTGLSGVLTCVVYAKLTRPEKLSRDGVGFSKKAVISMRDGRLCLMFRAWDLNYDHIISSDFTAYFINTHKTKEGEIIRYYARTMPLQQRQFLLWPVTMVHIIDATSPLFQYNPDLLANNSYEITISLKGASASLGTFTQSQTSYMPGEIVWGHRFPPVVQYDSRKQRYVIDHKKLDAVEPVETPPCSASELYSSANESEGPPASSTPGTPSSFGERISSFVFQRSSSFRQKETKS